MLKVCLKLGGTWVPVEKKGHDTTHINNAETWWVVILFIIRNKRESSINQVIFGQRITGL